MKVNKYLYVFVVQANYGYGHGWEDLTESESYRCAVADLRAYRENDYHACGHRLIKRRVFNPEYKGGL